jgi:hypothetical protein
MDHLMLITKSLHIVGLATVKEQGSESLVVQSLPVVLESQPRPKLFQIEAI